MRELKFRAWDDDEGVMYYSGGYSSHGEYLTMAEFWRMFEKYDFLVERYTGLRDANGREIYEGDVVAVLYLDGPVRGKVMTQDVVRWGVYNIGVNSNEYDFYVVGPYVEDEYLYDRLTAEDVVVTSNIHEGAELEAT